MSWTSQGWDQDGSAARATCQADHESKSVISHREIGLHCDAHNGAPHSGYSSQLPESGGDEGG